ncbi:uncharacterized protein LOC111634321 [Centruroides sculpturatus]|uniref:uncharacterized protein LOC111634321 n=1 Tax=Centruroides sculpturatus TaxID=218467 RepID=UPI000C6DDCD0|nr:uncharacterized protein LOC111634321 [Centruroides sculpturatus]
MGLKSWWIQLKTIIREKTETNIKLWLIAMSAISHKTFIPNHWLGFGRGSSLEDEKSERKNSIVDKTKKLLGLKNIRIAKNVGEASGDHFKSFMEKYGNEDTRDDHDEDLEEFRFQMLLGTCRFNLDSLTDRNELAAPEARSSREILVRSKRTTPKFLAWKK